MNARCDKRHEAWPLFLRTYATVMEVLESELRAETGLPLAWFDVLIRLYDRPDGRVRMQELADSVLLSKSGFTRLADRMESAGLIARRPCEHDRRVVYAAITPKGRRTFDRAAPVAFAGVQRYFCGPLTPREMAALGSTLTKILAGIRPPQAAERRAAG